jgi:hypothetical protein
MDAQEAFPISSTLCLALSLTRNASDTAHFDNHITFFEQANETVPGNWVRRRAVLDGPLLHSYTNTDSGREETIHVSTRIIFKVTNFTLITARYINFFIIID